MQNSFTIILSENQSNISVQGELDVLTERYLNEFLENSADLLETDLTIDCEKLLYIDSCGINALERALNKMNHKGLKIHLINLRGNVKKLFKITNLDSVFEL